MTESTEDTDIKYKERNHNNSSDLQWAETIIKKLTPRLLASLLALAIFTVAGVIIIVVYLGANVKFDKGNFEIISSKESIAERTRMSGEISALKTQLKEIQPRYEYLSREAEINSKFITLLESGVGRNSFTPDENVTVYLLGIESLDNFRLEGPLNDFNDTLNEGNQKAKFHHELGNIFVKSISSVGFTQSGIENAKCLFDSIVRNIDIADCEIFEISKDCNQIINNMLKLNGDGMTEVDRRWTPLLCEMADRKKINKQRFLHRSDRLPFALLKVSKLDASSSVVYASPNDKISLGGICYKVITIAYPHKNVGSFEKAIVLGKMTL